MMVSLDEDGSISTYVSPIEKKESPVEEIESKDIEKKVKTKPSDYDVFYG